MGKIQEYFRRLTEPNKNKFTRNSISVDQEVYLLEQEIIFKLDILKQMNLKNNLDIDNLVLTYEELTKFKEKISSQQKGTLVLYDSDTLLREYDVKLSLFLDTLKNYDLYLESRDLLVRIKQADLIDFNKLLEIIPEYKNSFFRKLKTNSVEGKTNLVSIYYQVLYETVKKEILLKQVSSIFLKLKDEEKITFVNNLRQDIEENIDKINQQDLEKIENIMENIDSTYKDLGTYKQIFDILNQKNIDESFWHINFEGVDLSDVNFGNVKVNFANLENNTKTINFNPKTVRFKSLYDTNVKRNDIKQLKKKLY